MIELAIAYLAGILTIPAVLCIGVLVGDVTIRCSPPRRGDE